MAGPILYSTNPWFTEIVCEHYRNRRYQVWCSEVFDPASHGSSTLTALTPPSSSPKPLYYEVLNAVQTSYQGNQKIIQYRRTFRRLVRDWFSRNEISQTDRDDILAMVVKEPWLVLLVTPGSCDTARGRRGLGSTVSGSGAEASGILGRTFRFLTSMAPASILSSYP